ncbi:MAG: hypothetical protein WDO72_12315 [Pseudomonadota bacterium]
MNLPHDPSREPTTDRRAVPRHIRDGEHDVIDEAVAPAGAEKAAIRRMLLWICAAILLAGAFGLWLTMRAG